MKQLLAVLCAFALSFSFAQAQLGDGSGPNGNTYGDRGTGGMWAGFGDNIPEEIQDEVAIIQAKRTELQTLRQAYLAENNVDLTDPEAVKAAMVEFRAQETVQAIVAEMQTNLQTVRTYFRENRPDRPDDVVRQRRAKIATQNGEINALRKQLRDPAFEGDREYVRQQLQERLDARKDELRQRRRAGEGTPGGEGGPNGNGG